MNTLAVRLTIPPVGFVGDFHSLVNTPCRAYQKKARTDIGLFGLVFMPARRGGRAGRVLRVRLAAQKAEEGERAVFEETGDDAAALDRDFAIRVDGTEIVRGSVRHAA